MGGVVSTTATVWLHVSWFPNASLTSHVRVALRHSPHAGLVTVVSTLTIALVPVTVGASKSHAVPSSTVRLVAHVTTTTLTGALVTLP